MTVREETCMQEEFKNRIKVELYTSDNETHWGYVDLNKHSDLVDLMNDPTHFIEVRILCNKGPCRYPIDNYKSAVINKDTISRIREI